MIKTSFLLALLLMASCMASVLAQFGVPRDRKAGTTFQEVNERAKEQYNKEDSVGAGLGDLMGGGGLGGADMGDMAEMMRKAMSDPEMLQAMQQLQEGMMENMDQLSGLSSEELKSLMTKGLEELTGDDMLNTILGQSDEVLDTLAKTGMATPEQLAKWKADPQAMQEDMKEAFGQFKDVLSTGDTMDSAIEMLKSIGSMVQDTEKMVQNLNELFDTVESSTDEEIETARLQLLEDPVAAFGGNEANPLAQMFQSEEIMEILKDPVKWREHVREGQKALKMADDEEEDADGIKDEL